VANPVILVATDPKIWLIGKGLTQLRIPTAVLILLILSTAPWTSPFGIKKSTVYSEFSLQGMRTVCPSF